MEGEVVPCSQSQRKHDALRERGMDTEMLAGGDVPHLFDLSGGSTGIYEGTEYETMKWLVSKDRPLIISRIYRSG